MNRLATLAAVLETWPGSTVIDIADDDLGVHAVAYAAACWEVFRCHGKVPAIARRDGGRGVLDATADVAQVATWWTRYPTANIGGRVPAGVVVVDVDPRSGGDGTWAGLTVDRDDVATRTVMSGRGDGGRHYYYRHPGGRLHASLGPGVDVKTHAGYVMLPPSIHPDTGGRYRWVDPAAPILPCPPWLAELLRVVDPPPLPRRQHPAASRAGDSPADWYTATRSWADVLEPHGWRCTAGNGDDDGSSWVRPDHTSSCSATIRHGCLFVYSTNTPFVPTAAEAPAGYTPFRAYAVLDHGGDLAAAARAVAAMRGPS